MMKFTNTLSGLKEEFVPIVPGASSSAFKSPQRLPSATGSAYGSCKSFPFDIASVGAATKTEVVGHGPDVDAVAVATSLADATRVREAATADAAGG